MQSNSAQSNEQQKADAIYQMTILLTVSGEVKHHGSAALADTDTDDVLVPKMHCVGIAVGHDYAAATGKERCQSGD